MIFVCLFMTLTKNTTSQSGFTLLEILVVTAVVITLMSVVSFNLFQLQPPARDRERQADLRTMQAAIEAYRRENGSYPLACESGQDWSGQPGSGYECDDPTEEYIIGLAPKYIPTLLVDPQLNEDESRSGYVYQTTSNGSVYKLMALNTVEELTVNLVANENVEFSRCGEYDQYGQLCYRTYSGASGNPNDAGGNSSSYPSDCADPNTYAVFGGFSLERNERRVEYYTEQVICD